MANEHLNPREFIFDPNKEYGNCIIVTDLSEIDQYKDILRRNAKLIVPLEFQDDIAYTTTYRNRSFVIEVREDNYEMLGVTKRKIGNVLCGIPHWCITWKYKKTG